MAIHIRTRNNLIDWLGEHTFYRSIARAIQEGQVENLGAFDLSSGPGWIIRVTSEFHKVWYIKITPCQKLGFYGVVLLDHIPWDNWIGDKLDNKLYQGDKPEEYKLLRHKEIHDAETEG